MSEKFYNKPRPIEPISKEEWDIHERYREVSRSLFLEGKRGKEAYSLALRNLRTYFQEQGINPLELETGIMHGIFGDMIKETLLHARFWAGETLSEDEKQFHKSHINLIT